MKIEFQFYFNGLLLSGAATPSSLQMESLALVDADMVLPPPPPLLVWEAAPAPVAAAGAAAAPAAAAVPAAPAAKRREWIALVADFVAWGDVIRDGKRRRVVV